MSRYRRGDVLWLDITGKKRPWLVVSNNINNLRSNRINVVYMTTNEAKAYSQPTHCVVEYGNVRRSVVCAEEIHTVEPGVETEIYEHIPREHMTVVEECMRVQLELNNR